MNAREGRTSPRQALVALATTLPGEPVGPLAASLGDGAAEELWRCRLLDVVGGLVQVNGATLTVVAADAAQADRLRAELPAGVDVVALAAPCDPATVAAWAIRRHLERSFERVLVLREDALPLPARTAATGLSVLVRADLVVGPTPGGGAYLVGAADSRGADLVAGTNPLLVEDVEERARAVGLVVRRLEPRRSLAEVATFDELRVALGGNLGSAPRLAGWLARFGDAIERGR